MCSNVYIYNSLSGKKHIHWANVPKPTLAQISKVRWVRISYKFDLHLKTIFALDPFYSSDHNMAP